MSRRAVPKANPEVRSTQGTQMSRRAVPKANPEVLSTQGNPVNRVQIADFAWQAWPCGLG